MAKPATITLEEARAVIAAHHDEELRQKVEASQQYVGRFYRYRNSSGGGREKWWLYVAVTGVDELGVPRGWQFQVIPNPDVVQIHTDTAAYVWSGGYEEITAAEFSREAYKLAARVKDILVNDSLASGSEVRHG